MNSGETEIVTGIENHIHILVRKTNGNRKIGMTELIFQRVSMLFGSAVLLGSGFISGYLRPLKLLLGI